VALRPKGDEGRVRVLVADDQLQRAGLRLALEEHGVEICAEAGDAGEAVEAALRERPDVCLIGSRVGGDGIAATAEIRSKLPATPIVVLAHAEKRSELLAAVRAGASGYISVDTNPDRLRHVLDGVLEGEAAVPRKLVTDLIEELRERGPRRRFVLAGPADLTAREWEVVELLHEGLRTKDIAARLFISRETVRTHIASILHKLGLPDRESLLTLLAKR
jgi:DNA-binding NarL/FixJ family response regulator